MKKVCFIVFAMTALLAFIAMSLPCYAGKQKKSTFVSQPADDGVIYGCYKKVNGQLRVVNGPENCRPSEEPISWNQAGESGGIDLSNTYVKSCQNVIDCFCDDEGWVLNGHAECPDGAVLAGVGTPADSTDYGFHAKCIYLDGMNIEPANITIRCVGVVAVTETNCSDGIDDDADGAIDCADADCAADPACQSVIETDCTDEIDNDADGAIDCADADCAGDPACQQSAVSSEICSDGIDNDGDGVIDCQDKDCAKEQACKKKK